MLLPVKIPTSMPKQYNDILLSRANVVTPQRTLTDYDVLVRNGCITELAPTGSLNIVNTTIYDMGGDTLIPGLIDIHVHGAGGYDTMDGTPEDLSALRQALLREGTTAFLATTMSCSATTLNEVLANLAILKTVDAGSAEMLGAHVEGPLISPKFKGAQHPQNIWPDDPETAVDLIEHLCKSHPGLIRILTLAVERKGTPELAKLARNHQIILSAGHTSATYEEMLHAADLGVKQLTHAFNAMPGIHHRHPGPLTAALLDDTIGLEIIADAVHIHPAILDMTLRLKPADKVYLVSDGTRAVGMPDGTYELGGQLTLINQGMSMLPDGAIAGSAFPLLQGIRVLVQKLGYPIHKAVCYATLNPAHLLGVSDRLGSLEPGKEATLVRLSSDLAVKQIWQYGMLVLCKP
jgi:N-acetylglucosamine-6-phosphate deacetylase